MASVHPDLSPPAEAVYPTDAFLPSSSANPIEASLDYTNPSSVEVNEYTNSPSVEPSNYTNPSSMEASFCQPAVVNTHHESNRT